MWTQRLNCRTTWISEDRELTLLTARPVMSYRPARVRTCEKMESAPQSGAQQVAPGRRSAARGLPGFNTASPGRGDRNDCYKGLSVAPPGLPSLVAPYRGLRASRLPPATCFGPCRGLVPVFSQLLIGRVNLPDCSRLPPPEWSRLCMALPFRLSVLPIYRVISIDRGVRGRFP